jgi:hypothetical protein
MGCANDVCIENKKMGGFCISFNLAAHFFRAGQGIQGVVENIDFPAPDSAARH